MQHCRVGVWEMSYIYITKKNSITEPLVGTNWTVPIEKEWKSWTLVFTSPQLIYIHSLKVCMCSSYEWMWFFFFLVIHFVSLMGDHWLIRSYLGHKIGHKVASENWPKLNKGVCHTVALPFTLKCYLNKAKEELWKLKYLFHLAKI
jgi:hypothetical protein